MKNKLAGSLSEVLSEAFDIGYTLDVNTTLKSAAAKHPCYILSNLKAGKVGLLGQMSKLNGEIVVKSFLIDVHKWNWASNEGFTIDDIFNEDRLYSTIFTDVPVETLPALLA